MAKKKNKNNNRPQKSTSDILNENAALRLKIFIEDLRHDPMFRHRLFYPVMYKEVIRSNQYTKYDKDKPKDVVAPVSQVIYEYYLLKMEKFSKDNAARIFQAIIYSNGPMLPNDDRLYMMDSSEQRSILNPRNRDTVIKRTKMFLDVLQDETLFNFVFNETVGKNLDHMRTRFRDIASRMHNNAGASIATRQINKDLQNNLNSFREYFAHVSDQDITEVVNFLTYMGNPRNVVTDFSYRPMDQQSLDNYLSYNTDETSMANDEFRSQIEQALDANVLQKDLTSQLDTFVPMMLKEYASICSDDAKHVCAKLSNFSKGGVPYELQNILKTKLKRSIKQIHDYTRNYLTRKLLDNLDNSKSRYNDNLFISRILNKYLEVLTDSKNNHKTISQISRDNITFGNFVGSANDDLADLIKTLFVNDVEYVHEVCSDASNCTKTQSAFTNAWDAAKTKTSTDILSEIISKIKMEMSGPHYYWINILHVSTDNMMRTELDRIMRTHGITGISITDMRDKIYKDIEKEYGDLLTATSLNAAELVAKKIYSLIKSFGRRVFGSIYQLSTDDNTRYASYIASAIAYVDFINDTWDHIEHGILDHAASYDDIKIALYLMKGMLGVIEHFKSDLIDSGRLLAAARYFDAIDGSHALENIYMHFFIIYFNSAVSHEIPYVNTITAKIPNDMSDFYTIITGFSASTTNPLTSTEIVASHLLEVYFKYYLKPVLVNFFGYALDNFEYTTRKNDMEADVVSKDVLHFSKLLTPKNVGLLTIDGAVIHDIAKFTYILTSDQFTGVTYNDPDSVMKFLDDVYGIKYFNVIIYGRQDAYLYLNNVGVPYLYRGAKTKIPIRELRRNYDFLMDPATGLYKNISLPKKRH